MKKLLIVMLSLLSVVGCSNVADQDAYVREVLTEKNTVKRIESSFVNVYSAATFRSGIHAKILMEDIEILRPEGYIHIITPVTIACNRDKFVKYEGEFSIRATSKNTVSIQPKISPAIAVWVMNNC